MGMGVLPIFFLLATIVATSQGYSNSSCLSWRLGVETNNIRNWDLVPLECGKYVADYMLGKQYRKDSQAVAKQAFLYAQSLNLAGDGKDIWVFDIDETTLSNLPYYAEHGFGTKPADPTAVNEWASKGKTPALPESFKLYRKLLSLRIKVVSLTGRSEARRNLTATNLKNFGYYTWEKLILRASSYSGKTTIEYKSDERRKLEQDGYRIIGNMGDQWSDLLGIHAGSRTFKLPNPMYYIP